MPKKARLVTIGCQVPMSPSMASWSRAVPMLDEHSMRRAEFTEGPRIELGDGQEWTFPRPWLRLYPVRALGGGLTVGGGFGYGADHDDLVDRLIDCDSND